MTAALTLPRVAGRLTANAPLGPLIWFKAGGSAEMLFEPADRNDLARFLATLDPAIPVWPLGLGSNLIVRDGGIPGVTIRLGKGFARAEAVNATTLLCGAAAPGILVASVARDADITGLEFLRGIPGTIGGAARMNAGAYGSDMAAVVAEVEVVTRSGELKTLSRDDLRYSYRHAELEADAIVISVILWGEPGDRAAIAAEMDRIVGEREAAQPLRSRTGGSTFRNPAGHKAWALIDAAGCRGLRRGGAQVSEKHANFLINTGGATSADLEGLGDEVRARVLTHSGVELAWEIVRVGRA